MTNNIIKGKSLASDEETEAYIKLAKALKDTPIPSNEILANLNLFSSRSSLARTLFMSEIYNQILNSHGVIMEFGVRWGQNLALLTSLRNLHEPYNCTRKVIGFDTFSGFPHVDGKDGSAESAIEGALGVTDNYDHILSEILKAQEALGPRSNILKHRLIKGDVIETLPKYLEQHPETLISMVYFDFDLYQPTLFALECIKPYLTKGSIIAFDELVSEEYPGETVAFREVLGANNYELKRSTNSPYQSYIIYN